MKAGWKFKTNRFTTAWKRQREGCFTDLRPKKRGRISISEDLKKQIEEYWIENSRAGANLMVTNPNNRKEKRIGLRLTIPALQVMLQCPLVRTKLKPDGVISTTTFSKYRP